MNAKERFYSGMARETIGKLTNNKENWTSFLKTMARNYGFTYPEQVMIHAQRPEAVLCKEFDAWREEKNRYVKRGAKGIALFVTDQDHPHLRYVFDVSDTGTRKSSLELTELWRMREEYRDAVQNALKYSFGVELRGTMEMQMEAAAMSLASEYWLDNRKSICDILVDSYLEGYDEYNIEMIFQNVVANSSAYAVYSRIMDDPDVYFVQEDFLGVFDFNTRQAVNALGTAVSMITSRICMEIERAIREYEQNRHMERSLSYDERNELQTDRRGSDSGYDTGDQRKETAGQVRKNEESVSGTEQSDTLKRHDPERNIVSPPVGDRQDSAPESGIVDEPVPAERSGTGQRDTADVMGTAHESPESTSRGSGDDGTYQQLSLPFFLAEEQQIHLIDEAESQKFSAFSFAQNEIDHFLLIGSNTDEARKIIALEYMKQKSVEEIVQILKEVYHGGFGLKEDSGNISAWYAEDGIHLAKGSTAIDSSRVQVISWEDAARRIGELLENGKFATNVELEEAPGYERQKLAESIWYLHQDFSEEAHEGNYLAILTRDKFKGFTDETADLAEKLNDLQFHSILVQQYAEFRDALARNRDLLRFRYHKLDKIGKRLEELHIPLREYQADMLQMPLVQQFITDDEVNKDLTRGNGFTGGKARIYNYWQENHSTKEKADFLKHEFGTGGHSHACSGASHSGEDHDAKGIRYTKAGCDKVQISWTQAVQRIDSLIKKGRYLTPEEDAERQAIEEAKAEPLEEVYERFAVVDTEDGEYADVAEEKPITEEFADGLTHESEQETEHFMDHFYVVEDVQKRGALDIKEYSTLEDALRAYHELPPTRMKALGAMNTGKPLPGSLDIVHCKNGQDTIIEDYTKVDGWQNPEVMDAIAQIEQSIQNREIPPVPAVNFHIIDDHIGEGGPKQKFARNIEAIETLFILESENRNATPEEQEILSNYVGWGGLADAFDPSRGNWTQEYQTLKNLLSEDEYAAARASTLNAHYTSPTVIRSIYDAVGQMGFETGNILEPAMGIGNFFGMLPPQMQSSRLYGVELDSITGRIAQKLYPNAEIKVAGFETTDRRDFYDLAVGNVPFGNYKVSDKPYDKLGFSIHNYFFAKTLDQVRPGGIIAFVTSHYTMDSKNPDARKYMAQRAELLGAVRLPNDAFKKNAGTEVVSDILFLQKRDHPVDIVPDWVHLSRTEEGCTMNSYFVAYPEMVLGETVLESTPYGKEDITVKPFEGADLSELLKEAVSHIKASYQAVEFPEANKGKETEIIPADPDVKNFSYAVADGEVYFRENSIMRCVDLNEVTKDRVIGMVNLRKIVNELIELQLEDYPDEEILKKQAELNEAYDAFTAKYGLINNRINGQAFCDDSSYYLLCSLENVDEDGNLKSKADMFTKRTIKPDRKVTSVDTPSEALTISIGERGRVDLPFMAELLGTPGDYEAIINELRGVIFKDPMEPEAVEVGWQTADEYLSGDVRSKLRIARMAAEHDSPFLVNVQALEKAQLKDLDASEIDVRLGATWIEPAYIQEFMQETFETPYYLRRSMEVKYAELTAKWMISGKNSPSYNDVAAYVTYGTERANAYWILEETLNLKDIRIYDTIEMPDGKQERVLNKKETTLAQQKQQAMKDAFRDWIWKNPYRREALVTKYNELFNSVRPREYDGSHIRFGGMNPDISLREHQRNAVAHVLYGGNTLLAHEVGAGKSFEMAASAMESKRLGLCQKSLFVVPNHLILQWANEFLRLYPSANLLVATKKDFETANRKKFCARIATGDYDAVIIGHSQFERIPLSAERQERQLREQIDEMENAITELKAQRGEHFTIKQMEKTRKSLDAKLSKLLSAERKDDVITFEQLGVDRLFVDESQAFKNLFLQTKMRNVAGLSTSESQKSADMFMKCRYMDELTGGRGVIFATGTPVSNSMSELYTVMRYLQYGTLQQKGLTHFDCWASTFGETTTAIELAPEGTGYRARTRFAKFFNLPELMNMFKEVADIKTSDQLNLPVPEARFETVVVQPSEMQKEMVAALSERAAAIHAGIVDPSEDNMLKVTGDGRKIGLDQRLMNTLLPDDPGSKLNTCINNILRIYREGEEKLLTQLVFCDMSVPKKDGTFNVYDDIRTKLTAAGVPAEQVAFIHDADTEVKKKELFAKVRTGQVRVLLGSTQKMGAGTNVQDKLVAVHHLDVGWRPSDMTQRNGRIIRQGNQNKEVQIYQYVTEGTFDAYLYQTLENKQKFISQIMSSKSPVRSCDDVDEQALSYAEIKALCAGNPMIKEKMDLDVDVARLKVLKADHQSQQYRMEDRLLKYFPAKIEEQVNYINRLKADIQTAKENPQSEEGFCGMQLKERFYTDKQEAGEALLAVCKEQKGSGTDIVGSYRGFVMELTFDRMRNDYSIALKNNVSHTVYLGTDARGNLIRLDNGLKEIPEKLENAMEHLDNLYKQQEATKAEFGKPFPQETELTEKSRRLAELDAALNMEETVAEHSPRGGNKISVLADLKEKSAHIQPSNKKNKRDEMIL